MINNAIAAAEVTPCRSTGYTAFDRLLRQRVLSQLDCLDDAQVVLEDACGSVALGKASGSRPVRVTVSSPAFYQAVAASGSVGAGEAYMAGHWQCDDLVGLVRMLVRNREVLDAMESGWARLGGWALRRWHALRRNTEGGSRRNIAAHYDLGNEFFSLFLSSDQMYSAAYWQGDQDTLDAASQRKLQLICQKLKLAPQDHLIEIGSGWGALAVYAATHCGCKVTTTTISREQYAAACRRVARAGVADRVTVLREDYRNLTGAYDKLVSIEMIEAVGADYIDAYFSRVGKLLKPDGLALIQAITIEDHRYQQALGSVDFIKRHVFPGSFIPSIAAMLAAKTRVSDLALLALEDFGSSYARTLAAWRERFMSRLAEVRALGFDDRFIRLWDFYLAYCEGGFHERSIGVAHLLLAKPGYRP
jgi:cyclopropane-fatty-acyl-phospholipid synthase